MDQNNYFDVDHPLHPYIYSLNANPGTTSPVNALRGKKPTAKKGYHPGEKNGVWIDIEDHRGEKGFLDGKECIINDFGPLPKGWSEDPPAPTSEERARLVKAEIDARLAEIDFASIRPLRALLEDSGSKGDREKLSTLEQEASNLRAQRTKLN